MKTIILERFAWLPDRTLGRLFVPELSAELCTLERPWANNAPFHSCIPFGAYTLAPYDSPRWSMQLIQVCDVPDRSWIMFHPGNTPADTQGCILPGRGFGAKYDLVSSASTFNQLHSWIEAAWKIGSVELFVTGHGVLCGG